MNTQNYTTETVQKWASLMRKDSSLVVYQDAQGNKYLGKTVHGYLSRFLKDATNGNLLLSKDKPAAGVRSFDGNKLPKGVRQLMLSVRGLIDTTTAFPGATTENDLAELNYANLPVGGIKNAEFKIIQGETELVRSTISNIVNWRASTSNSDDYLAINPATLRDNVPTSFIITLPDGTVVNNTAIKIEYLAFEFIDVINA